MTEKEHIVHYIITNKKISKELINKCPKPLQNDFKQHFILQILEMNDSKLIKAYNEGYIINLCCKIILNQINSGTSQFHKLFRQYSKITNPIFDTDDYKSTTEYDHTTDQQLKQIEDLLSHVTDKNQADLFRLYYMKGYTYKKIEEITGINYQTVRQSVLKTVDWIKNKIELNGLT